MHKSLLATASLVLASGAWAQNPRAVEEIDLNTNSAHPSVASSGGFAATAYVDDTSAEVLVTMSNDNGLTWSTPEVISSAVGTKTVEAWSVHVIGNQVFVGYENDPGNDDVYFNYFDGAVWTGEQYIDKGFPEGAGVERDWRMDVSQGTSGINIVFAFGTEPDVGGTNEDLYVTSSQDGGVNFGSAVYVPSTPAQAEDVDDIRVAVEGDDAYVVWADDRSGLNDMFMQKSTDGGATWTTFATEKQIDQDATGDAQFGMDLDVNGSTVGIVWNEERPDGGNEQLRGVVSTDGGTTLGSDLLVGNYTPVTDDVDNPVVAVAQNGNVVACWEDNRSGGDEIYVASTTDGGTSWNADALASKVGSGGGFPRATAGGASDTLGFGWGTGSLFPNQYESVYTLDGGVTFSSTLTLSDNPAADVDFAEIAYDDVTENFVAPFLSDDSGVNDLYVSGYAVCNPSTVTNRSDAANVDSYVSTAAVIGGTWTATVDLSTTGHSMAILYGQEASANTTLGGGQVLLIDLASPRAFQLIAAGPLASFSAAIPNDPILCGFEAFTQAGHFGGVSPFALSNAQDLLIGAF